MYILRVINLFRKTAPLAIAAWNFEENLDLEDVLKSANLLNKRGLGDSQSHSTVHLDKFSKHFVKTMREGK